MSTEPPDGSAPPGVSTDSGGPADAALAGTIAGRLAAVHGRIAAAARRRGAGPSVRLVAVSKRQPVGAIEVALAAGHRDFGENYAQELRDKRSIVGPKRARWHFIGPLQSNKVKYVVGSTLIHTVDRPKILMAIDKRAVEDNLDQDVLVQVNVSGEATKSGVAPHEVSALLDRFADLERVRCRGLMTMPPAGPPEQARACFVALRKLAEQLRATTRPRVELTELSMGMSGDFEVAVEEGATLVRVGTAIFGARPPADSPM